jgi:hypothetical protein
MYQLGRYCGECLRLLLAIPGRVSAPLLSLKSVVYLPLEESTSVKRAVGYSVQSKYPGVHALESFSFSFLGC